MTGRQTTRPTPRQITAGPDGHVFTAAPLPWRKRNDLGNLINSSYMDSITEAIRAFTEDGERVPEVKVNFRESLFDWEGVFKLSYPTEDAAEFEKLDIYEMREVLCGALEVNGLESLRYMIDPNFQNPLVTTENQAGPTDGQKTTSSEGSGDSATQ